MGFLNAKEHLTVSLFALLSVFSATSGAEVVYYHNDLLGSPVAATNASGHPIWRENYRPYGERLQNEAAGARDKIWFTSRHEDADTGLSYMGARYYDPMLGRFLSTDVVRFQEENIHSFNRYAYANNNPQCYVDPDGKAAQIAARVVYSASFSLATRMGAARLGSMITRVGMDIYDEYVRADTELVRPYVLSEGQEGANGTRTPAPALPGDPYSPAEVDRRRSQLRDQLGAPSNDPDSRIPDQGPGKDMGGHGARGRTPHETGERNVNSNEEHSRRPKGNPSGRQRR
jgi:RHS repeat-associated protein